MLCIEPYIDGVYVDSRSSTGKVYKKVVDARELELYKFVEKHGLCPKLIEVYDYTGKITIIVKKKVTVITEPGREQSEPHYVLVNEYFPKTLADFDDFSPLLAEIEKVMKKLHSIGVAHLDSHPDNIVVDGERLILLIDFGNSDYIKNITVKDAQNDEFNWGKKFDTVEELLAYEETTTYKEW